ncbi:MAG: bacillithiol biosynthesis deacetylase BshB1 [Chitinophagaceae bacterium]|nr:bacillithiol biosynthesis deacetylase BshB1 [Chitinophagaceae bacterium]
MKTDILAIGAHPDDVELGCGGTLIAHREKGYRVVVLDLTKGELGTRGSVQIRAEESWRAKEVMGVEERINAGFRDGFFVNDEWHQRELIRYIRLYQPDVVLANAIWDRHPDHGKGAKLVSDACFLSGLSKIETLFHDVPQIPWRPKKIYHYIQSKFIVPDIIVNVSPYWKRKIEAVQCYVSQFYDPHNTQPNTYISSPEFLKMIEARGKELGHSIAVEYGEGFTKESHIGVNSFFDIL